MNPEFIVIHHSLTKDSGTVSWGAIRTYHKSLGWEDIGYHWGVELINTHYEILVGRTMSRNGAHCKEASMNRRGIGICCVGNFDDASMPRAQEDALVRLVQWLRKELEITIQRVIGHRQAGLMEGKDWQKGEFKSCPGKLFDINAFRLRLKEEDDA